MTVQTPKIKATAISYELIYGACWRCDYIVESDGTFYVLNQAAFALWQQDKMNLGTA